MRDPLRNVSVRYKLPFAFIGVCLLAFGVGGFFVSRSARESLEREIMTLLRLQSQFHAAALEGDLRALGLRARDFASDGYIRKHFEELAVEHEGSGVVRAQLRQHLLVNKLPLESAFLNLALADSVTGRTFVADVSDSAWLDDLPARAFAGEEWFSGLVSTRDAQGPPSIVLSTPLLSLSGDRPIGTLLVKVHTGVWIAKALGSIPLGGDPESPEFRLSLHDRGGRWLEIPRSFTDRPGPSIDSLLVREGLGLRAREPGEPGLVTPPGSRGVLSQSFQLDLNGWTLETTMQTQEALAAVSGLQARFLMVGVILSAAACVLLLFPMRFLARPIRELRDAAKLIRAGDFRARVPVESSDEVGELSRSFNAMAQAVEEHAEELEATAKSLELRKNELAVERDRLNAVILSMRDGLVVLDVEGKPEVWNAAGEPLRTVVENGGLGLRSHRNCRQEGANEVFGANTDEHDEHPCLKCLFEPSAPSRSCLLDAGPFVYEVHSSPLASKGDRRSGRVLVARDVTSRVEQDEREIHQERLSVLGEVAAVMAHELNNPLAAISMFTQMIASKLPEDSALRDDVKVIERNTQACSRTIRELLDYATGATPEVGPVNVHESLEEVASFLRAFRERKDTDLELVLNAPDPVVRGDEVQLRQVFVNLIMNALQAAHGGHVSVTTRVDDGHLEVDVRDDGPGIDSGVGDEVFRPFFTTKPRGSGTGLGLSTARRITEIQGGGLDLVSAGPGDTTFRVRLLRGNP